jgi:enamine deaminase RidA (YjgF/YER057c/UK114 family)
VITVAARIRELGLALPPPVRVPPGIKLPFEVVRVHGSRVLVAGHGPIDADGNVAPIGRVGAELDIPQAYQAARSTALAILASLVRTLGEPALDRLVWLKAFGMVRSAPGFVAQPLVINGFSDLILELFGAERGAHARSAVGMAELPFGMPVEIEAELAL